MSTYIPNNNPNPYLTVATSYIDSFDTDGLHPIIAWDGRDPIIAGNIDDREEGFFVDLDSLDLSRYTARLIVDVKQDLYMGADKYGIDGTYTRDGAGENLIRTVTYLLRKHLDEKHGLDTQYCSGKIIRRAIYLASKAEHGRNYTDLQWNAACDVFGYDLGGHKEVPKGEVSKYLRRLGIRKAAKLEEVA